jgi:RNA polymerase sigma factor (TIGR02999 family)
MRRVGDDTLVHLLERWSAGDREAAEVAMPLVYDELRRIARNYFRREPADHTLQPTAIVHEAYLQLSEQHHVHFRSRAHFLGVVATLMRRILVDHHRRRIAAKRGDRRLTLNLDQTDLRSPSRDPTLLALDDALRRLTAIDADKAAIVELRYFGGLTVPEVAECLAVSPSTVDRHWRMARAWLYSELHE